MTVTTETGEREGARAVRVQTIYRSPIGELLLVADERALLELRLPEAFGGRASGEAAVDARGGAPVLAEAIAQLDGYFAGTRTRFDLGLEPAGTPFQQQVWRALADIAYATTDSYGSVAAQIGNPKASRAVGMANNRNPLPIVLPCHRVIGASGRLVGYGGGLEMKRWLLDHEAAVAGRPVRSS